MILCLSIIAAFLHGLAYYLYICSMGIGASVPNPSSWSVWVIFAVINALSFWKGTKSAIKTMQMFTGSVGCLAVWLYAFCYGKFSQIDEIGWLVLGFCVFAIMVWVISGKATYANVLCAIILVISFIPTVNDVWLDGASENFVPWVLWALAFIITTIVVYLGKHDKHEMNWYWMLVTPIVGIVTHATVAVLTVF